MKLFIIAALIAVSAAGRLEHLERSYLPPGQAGQHSNGFGSNAGSHGSFGSNGGQGSFGGNQGAHGSFGGNGASHGSFGGSQGSFGSNGFGAKNGASSFHSGSSGFGVSGAGSFGTAGAGSFGAATSNQYLPPDHGPSGGSGSTFGRQQGSFGGQGSQGHGSFGGQGSQGHGSFGGQGSQGQGSFGGHGGQGQFGAASRQYLAPKTGPSFQNIPQQSFDEETGYHY